MLNSMQPKQTDNYMRTQKRDVLQVIRDWQRERSDLRDRIELLGLMVYERPRSSVRRKVFRQLSKIRGQMPLFFETEAAMLDGLVGLRPKEHERFATYRDQAVRKHRHVMATLSETIEDWESDRPAQWETGAYFFEVFCNYWELLEELVENVLTAVFPSFPSQFAEPPQRRGALV